MSVVLHERTVYGGETFDPAVWEAGWEESLSALLPADMITWVALGSAGYQAAGIEEYAPGKPVNGGMPAWADSLTAEELMSVVLHERTVYGGETFDAAVWEEGWEESLTALLPQDKVDEYTAVLEEWKADPPAWPARDPIPPQRGDRGRAPDRTGGRLGAGGRRRR
jgi:hypothetical protein